MGKLLHGENDPGHPLNPVQTLGDGLGNFFQQIIHVQGFFCLGHGLGRFPQLFHGKSPGTQFPVPFHKIFQIREGILQKPDVVSDKLGGRVDFVSDAGSELPYGFQLLGLSQLAFQELSVGDLGPMTSNPIPRFGPAPPG